MSFAICPAKGDLDHAQQIHSNCSGFRPVDGLHADGRFGFRTGGGSTATSARSAGGAGAGSASATARSAGGAGAGATAVPSAAQAKPEEQTARGELSSIDPTAKMLTIKPAAGAEQKFQYNDSTKVTGARGGVAGLATESGKQVTVHFKTEGANRVATEIEVQADEKK